MSAELENKLQEVFDTFNFKYLHEIVDIFQREFSEENVDYDVVGSISKEAFYTRFIERFKVYDVDGSHVKLCSELLAEDNGYDYLYDVDLVEDYGEHTLDEVFNTLEHHDLLDAMSDFTRNAYILVHFPITKVTNERGQSTYIRNLFAKVHLKTDGLMTSSKFSLNRSHYTYAHFIHNYMHSHVSIIPKIDFTEFQRCCTGSGPINITMRKLQTSYDESQWMQFCWDLAKYVTVESEEGVPYNHLNRCNSPYIKGDEVKISNLQVRLKDYRNYFGFGLRFPDRFWINFVRYLIDNKVPKFRWANEQWEIADSPTEYIKIISNAFLEYYKENINEILSSDSSLTVDRLLRVGLLKKVLMDITGVYEFGGTPLDCHIEDYRNKLVVVFKGVEYRTVIEDIPENESVPAQVILDVKCIAYITGWLLKVLNTEYGKRYENSPSEPEIPFENL